MGTRPALPTFVMREERNNSLNLYRIMADVCAGSNQQSIASGEFGIVTVWVRAISVSAALARAGAILDDRRYSSIGVLHCYAEELTDDPLGCCATEEERARLRAEDRLLAGYDALKE
ncbi:MAG TPA: hypothetical protein VJ846_09255, partial [Sphingomicrobium sp.]|nr:hypothetical protein [Sphingomicrobium sp.]